MINLELQKEIQLENYIAALDSLNSQLEEATKLEKNEILEKIDLLLSNSIIAYRLSAEQFDRFNDLICNKFGKHSKPLSLISGSEKEAEFPTVDGNNSSIQALHFSFSKNTNDISDKLDSADITIFKLIELIQNKIQSELKNVTILNWGMKLNLRNRVYTGKLVNGATSPIRIIGNSYHFAAVVSLIAYIFDKPIDPDFIFTGAFDIKTDNSIRIGDITDKIDLINRERPNTKKFFIPALDCFADSEKTIIKKNGFIEHISNIDDLIKEVFGKSIKDLVVELGEKEKTLGYARIIVNYVGTKSLTFLKEFITSDEYNNLYCTTESRTINKNIIRFDLGCDDPGDRSAYHVFPLQDLEFNPEDYNLIIFNGVIPNHYFANITTSRKFRNFRGICGIRFGTSNKVFICLDQHGTGELLGYKCDFPE